MKDLIETTLDFSQMNGELNNGQEQITTTN